MCVKCVMCVSSGSIVGRLSDKCVSCVLSGWIGGRPVSCEVCAVCQVFQVSQVYIKCVMCVSVVSQVCQGFDKCMSSVCQECHVSVKWVNNGSIV